MLLSKLLTVAAAAVLLSGCSLFAKKEPISVVTTETPRAPLALPLPAPLQLERVRWVVITPDNSTQVWQRLQSEKTDTVLIGLTDHEYQKLAIDFARIRALIEEQRAIIIQYQRYYESPK